MHDALYAGLLTPRADIPYHPHVTVVASDDEDDCRVAQKELGEEIAVSGVIDALDVVEVDGANVSTVDRFPLVP